MLLIVDAAITNVIAPSISRDLAIADSAQGWIVNAYVIAFGGSLLVAGRLADSLGLVVTFRSGLVLLILGSVVAAVAPSAGIFFAGRAMQGLGSSLAAAASLALILVLFRGEERRAALGLLAAMAGLGGAIGTFSGGLLAEAWGWRATFIAIVAAATILLVAAMVFLVRDHGRARLAAKPLAGGLLLLVGQILLGHVDKWRIQRRIDVMSMKPRKLSAVLS